MRRYLDERLMDDVAIARLKSFEAEALAMHPGGYWLAFSGGKDSVVILALAKRARVKFEGHYNLTTCDPPELVRFIKTFPEIHINKPALTMWQLIRKKGLPRRQSRYCCKHLKEGGGIGRMVITGVRWGESNRRSKRQMVEACYTNKTKRFIHPIIDWTTADVWTYIRERGERYCQLYDEGFRRLGCVLCPMTRDVQRQMERWPRLCRAWERAAKAAYARGGPGYDKFADADTYWKWWLDRDATTRKDDQQLVLFEDDPDLTE